ncbi:hypothetical protein [Thalassobacterium sedimentorum]|uniref:hypothetical protein n=1 Tax=Thalassobacterium sedimentorum TaxID=3041258 RepID=UPI00281119EF|nr:hypothetical protein [Coraliomargarita sp. SDUM461004]
MRVETSAADSAIVRIEAQQNAYLAATIALGELQRYLGPDQRITARAEIMSSSDESKKNYTGVWGSGPDNLGMQLAWLASDWDISQTNYETQAAPVSGNVDVVTLVGDGSVDSTVDAHAVVSVSTADTKIAGTHGQDSGSYAWWVADENMKADVRPSNTSVAADAAEIRYHSVLSIGTKGEADLSILSDFSGDSIGEEASHRLSDISQLELAGYNQAGLKRQFHNFTVGSYGVLSNVRDGGLKQDLSLAFELDETAFENSQFAGAGSDTVPVLGTSIRAQPVFYDSNGGRGPSWHLLRDYYTIYQRMQNPLTNPVFPAQYFLPNHDEFGAPSGIGNPRQLASLRFDNINVWRQAASGDPLLSDSLPYLIRSQYAPYMHRWIQTIGYLFEPTTVSGSTDPYVKPKPYINPAGVYHNPYNVAVEHYGLMSLIDHTRFNTLLKAVGGDLVVRDSSGNYSSVRSINVGTSNNEFIIKIAPGTMSPGLSEVYFGIAPNSTNFSRNGTPRAEDFISTLGYNSTVFQIGISDVFIPVENGPNVQLDFAPFASGNPAAVQRWPVYEYHSMGSAENPVTSGLTRDNGFVSLYNYSAYFEDHTIRQDNPFHRIFLDNPEPFLAQNYIPARDGFFVDTDLHIEGSGSAPRPVVTIDNYLKTTEDSQSFPVYALSNPHSPIKGATNLIADEDGFPIFAPSWRMNTKLSPLAVGDALLQSANFGVDGGRNAYWGSSNDATGALRTAPLELPVTPPLSLGQLQSANVAILGTMPALAIGNSFATPYLDRDRIDGVFTSFAGVASGSAFGGQPRLYHDLSFYLNDTLFDQYFFSSYSVPYNLIADDFDPSSTPVGVSFDAAFDPSFSNASLLTGTLPNPRMQLLRHVNEVLEDVKNKLFDESNHARVTGVDRSSENLLVAGAFNVNSTSVDAWAAVLAAGRGGSVYQSQNSTVDTLANDHTAVSRSMLPSQGQFNGDTASDEAWSGYRALGDADIRKLAENIVLELRDRVNAHGFPYTSMSAFVNRDLSNDAFGLAGLLQAAIDRSNLNDSFELRSADLNTFPQPTNVSKASGSRAVAMGAASHINQADVLQGIGSFIQVRSDTFRVRAYGDSRDPLTGQVHAQAWCEMLVQRVPEPVYPNGNDPVLDSEYWEPDPTKPNFGRRFKVLSIRFLDEESV